MKLGAFSVSLAVKDINKSKVFYEALGFESFAGDISQNWLMLRNGETVIGLFQGMFEQNMLTFNPGWNQYCATLEDFIDVREIQSKLAANGIELTSTADETATGPGSCTLTDPDGNPILLDQHV